jgi:hypothetical protein
MSTTVDVNSSYVGKLAGDILVQAYKQADTIKKGAITVIPNVIGSGFLPKLEYCGELQAYSCGFNPNGDITYSEQEVQTKKFKLDEEICKEEFANTYAAAASGFASAWTEIPTSIKEALMFAMVQKLGWLIEKNIWRGDGTVNQFNGLLKQFDADTTVLKDTIPAVTPTNVVEALTKAYSLVPAALQGDSTVIMAVSYNVEKAYKLAQANNSNCCSATVGDKEMDFMGVKLVSLAGLPDNVILAYRVKNVAFLTGLQSDMNEIRVKDMDECDLTGFYRMQARFNAGVGYSWGAEIVYLKA